METFLKLKRKILLENQKRSPFWYIFFLFFIGILFILALFSSNFLFALFLILFTVIYWFLDLKEKENKYLNIYLDNNYLKLNKEVFSLNKDFISYEFLNIENLKKGKEKTNFPVLLRLDFKNRWRSSVFIPLKEEERERIEKILIDNQLKYISRKAENYLEELKKILKI